MRKLINEFDGLAAGEKTPSPQNSYKGILLVDCDGTLFDVKEESENAPLLPENNPLFDALIVAIKNGFAVVVHSGDQYGNIRRVNDALALREVNADDWTHADELGERYLVWDKIDSRKVVAALDPHENLPLLVIDDEVRFAANITKIYNIVGYKAQSALPTHIDAIKEFAKIGESAVITLKHTLEA